MKSLFYLLVAMTVMSLAFWAYRENYRTQDALSEMEAVQRDIAGLREELFVLRAEWAYLNRPERLRELVDINFDRLRLAPVQSHQFGTTRNVDYPDPDLIPPEALLPGEAPPHFVSNNRGAPKPRPSRAADGTAAIPATDAADDPETEPEPEPPADTAITETDPAPSEE